MTKLIVNKEDLLAYLESEESSIIDLTTVEAKIQKSKNSDLVVSLIENFFYNYHNTPMKYAKDMCKHMTLENYIAEMVPHFKFPRRHGVTTGIQKYYNTNRYLNVGVTVPTYGCMKEFAKSINKTDIANGQISQEIALTQSNIIIVDLASHHNKDQLNYLLKQAINKDIPVIMFG
jgi:hypothetical protein